MQIRVFEHNYQIFPAYKLQNSCFEMMKNVRLENLQTQPELLSRENVEKLLVNK